MSDPSGLRSWPRGTFWSKVLPGFRSKVLAWSSVVRLQGGVSVYDVAGDQPGHLQCSSHFFQQGHVPGLPPGLFCRPHGDPVVLHGPLHVALLCLCPSCLCYKLAASWPHGPGLSVLTLL